MPFEKTYRKRDADYKETCVKYRQRSGKVDYCRSRRVAEHPAECVIHARHGREGPNLRERGDEEGEHPEEGHRHRNNRHRHRGAHFRRQEKRECRHSERD